MKRYCLRYLPDWENTTGATDQLNRWAESGWHPHLMGTVATGNVNGMSKLHLYVILVKDDTDFLSEGGSIGRTTPAPR